VRFLADESCDFAVVRALRAAGHDVTAVAEERPGLRDRDVMARAEGEGRVVITEDKDFGQLAFSGGAWAVGCLFLRYPADARSSMGGDIVGLVHSIGARIPGSFVTAEPGRIRITRLPG
jgi:hypothetical protein